MVRKSVVGTFVLVMMTLVGCGTMQKGEAIVTYKEGEPLRMAEATTDGTYGLFAGTALRNPDVRYSLKKGDKLGFEMQDGKTVAVAGDHTAPIVTTKMTKSYFWRKL